MTIDAAERGLEVMGLVQAEQFGKLHDLFAPQLRAALTPGQLRAGWVEALAPTGPITSVGDPVIEPPHLGTTLVKFAVTCEQGAYAVLIPVDSQGWLRGLQLAPPEAALPVEPWQPPDYADPATFTESDQIIGTGPFAVPGTLSLPDRPGRLPAVVQLPGSGPQDRDTTMGRNKPLKDIAWGIATRGIAVLRFDKVTVAHPDTFDMRRHATVAFEYIDHAVAAVQLLRDHPSIDPARIFVLGHSEGAMVAPRVAATEPDVAGLVLLAGGTKPLHYTIIRQYRYLASLRPGADVDADQTVQRITEQAAVLDSPDFSASTPASELPLNLPAYAWQELLSLDPVTTAAHLDKPMLILQGGRDYQVTIADDLIGWQTGLADRDDVTIHIHDADNHLFFSGSGPSTPTEYEPAQHVDPAVVTDIADWIHAH